jgi:hypothetical protein
MLYPTFVPPGGNMVTVTAQQFNRDISGAKREALENGPVLITTRGTVTHVLLSATDYAKEHSQSLLDSFSADQKLGLNDALDEAFAAIPERADRPSEPAWIDD